MKMNTHGGSYSYYPEEMNSSYNHPRQSGGNYTNPNQIAVNPPSMGGYNQYPGYEENHPPLPQQNPYNTSGHMYSLQQAQHNNQSYMNQHYNSQYQNSYGMLGSNMEGARGNMPYNPGHQQHMQNSTSAQNQLPQHPQMRQISQQNPQEIANNILQMATSNYIPNNTVQVPLNKNRSSSYQTSHSPPYNANTSYNMPMHPSIQSNQHFSYSNNSPHHLSNMRTSPISPMHMNSPMSHHSGQSLPNSSPGSVQSPANSNSVRSPAPTPPNMMGSIRSPHRKQPLASPTGSTHSLKSPTPNQHVHSSGSQSISSPHNALGSMQSPGHHSQSHYSPVSCSPHSHLGSPYQVSRNQCHSPVNQLNQTNTSNKYMSEPQDFTNYVQGTAFNPLQSLQKLVMLPEKQVVDPKSVVGNTNVSNSSSLHDVNDMCDSPHQNLSKNLTASPDQCLTERTQISEISESISHILPNTLPHSSVVQDEGKCRDGRHCSGESHNPISNTVGIQGNENFPQNYMYPSGQLSIDEREETFRKTSVMQVGNVHHDSNSVESQKCVNEKLSENVCDDKEIINKICEKTVEDLSETSYSVIDRIQNGVDRDKCASSCDTNNTISPQQNKLCDDVYGKHKWVKDCNASKTNNSSIGNQADEDTEKPEVRKDFASNYMREGRYSVTPKKRYTQRLNYIEKNIAGENMESTPVPQDAANPLCKTSGEKDNSTSRVSEIVKKEMDTDKIKQNTSTTEATQNCKDIEEIGVQKVESEEIMQESSDSTKHIASEEPSHGKEETIGGKVSETGPFKADTDSLIDINKDSTENSSVTKQNTDSEHSKLDSSENSETVVQKNCDSISQQSSISKNIEEPVLKNETPKNIKKQILSEASPAPNNSTVLRRSARRRNFIDKFQSFSTSRDKNNFYNFHLGKSANTCHKQIKPNSIKKSVVSSDAAEEKSNHSVVEPDEKKTVEETKSSKSISNTSSDQTPNVIKEISTSKTTSSDQKPNVIKEISTSNTSSDKKPNVIKEISTPDTTSSDQKPNVIKENNAKQNVKCNSLVSPVKKRRKVTETSDEITMTDQNMFDKCDNLPLTPKKPKPSLPSKNACHGVDLMCFDVSVTEISADSIDPSVMCADSSNSNSSCPLTDTKTVDQKTQKDSSSNDKQCQEPCNRKTSKIDIKPKINKTVKRPKPKPFDLSDDEALKKMKLSKTLIHMNQTKKKKEGSSVGPYIHVEGSKKSPDHCKIINQTQEEALDSKNKKKLSLSSKASPSVQISNIPTEKSVFLPSSKLLADSEWVCALCKKHSCYKTLGDLFGPYFAEGFDPSIHCDTKSGKKISSKSPNICDNERRSKRLKTKSPLQNSAIDKPEPDTFDKTKEYWFHEDCVLWSDGVILVGSKVYGLEETIELVASTNCSSCKLFGATLGCLHKGCAQKYHFICAKEKGCYFDEENFSLLCLKHKDKKLKSVESKKSSNNESF